MNPIRRTGRLCVLLLLAASTLSLSISADSPFRVEELTDGVYLIPPGTTKNVFISLAVAASASQSATITSVDFFCDFDGDEVCTTVPGEMGSSVTVAPGTTGYVSASVYNPMPGDLDGDGDVDLGRSGHPAGRLPRERRGRHRRRR